MPYILVDGSLSTGPFGGVDRIVRTTVVNSDTLGECFYFFDTSASSFPKNFVVCAYT